MNTSGWSGGAKRTTSRSFDRVVALIETHAADVLGYLQRRTENVEDAADLLSETLVVAWRRIEDVPSTDEQARIWLFTTARFLLANHRRGRSRASALSARLREEMVAQVRAQDSGLHHDVAEAVRHVIEQLPSAQRELVTLVHWEGFTLAEAAALVGIPASTARSRYATARAELVQLLSTERETSQAPLTCAAARQAPTTIASPSQGTTRRQM